MSRLNPSFVSGIAVFTSSVATAQFTASAAGPINTFGQLGDAANGSISKSYSGPSTVFTSLSFSGTLTSFAGDTWESDSLWNVSGTGVGSNNNYRPSGKGSYTAPVNVSTSTNGLFWFQGGSNVNLRAFQHSGVSSDIRASWSNVSFSWSGGLSHVADLGSFVDPATLTFDTLGSTGLDDTHIALYTSSGTKLIDSDDISETNWLSSLSVAGLARNSYILVVGSTTSTFRDGFALPGAEATSYGSYNLNVNGSNFGTGTLAAGEFKTYSFEVVPEPGTMAVVGLGIAALLRRRRK